MVQLNDAIGFRDLEMKTHVRHLLTSGMDRRFQKHISYMFVVHNIIQRQATSFNAKLAVKRSWFPRVEGLLSKITDSTIEGYIKNSRIIHLHAQRQKVRKLLQISCSM